MEQDYFIVKAENMNIFILCDKTLITHFFYDWSLH